jgi:hypothetical protein
MTKVVVIEKFGGPEVLQWRDESLPAPGPGVRRHGPGAARHLLPARES